MSDEVQQVEQVLIGQVCEIWGGASYMYHLGTLLGVSANNRPVSHNLPVTSSVVFKVLIDRVCGCMGYIPCFGMGLKLRDRLSF